MAVVDRGFYWRATQPTSRSFPSTVSTRRTRLALARHVKSGTVTFRVHHASVRPILENRLQSDVLLGPGWIVRRHDKLDGNCYVCGEVVSGLNEVGWSGNREPVEQVEQRQDVACTDVNSDAHEWSVPPGCRSSFIQEPTNITEAYCYYYPPRRSKVILLSSECVCLKSLLFFSDLTMFIHVTIINKVIL